MRRRVLIVGVSTRAMAASAAGAGFDVTSIDAFGDLDHAASVRVLSLPRDFGISFTLSAVARAARRIDCDAVTYTSNFENRPHAVRALAAGRALWGNPPSVLRAVRDPRQLADAWRRHRIAAPAVRTDAAARGEWMIKPCASGGGRGVRRWSPGARVPRGCHLQAFVSGIPASVVFVAAHGRAVPIGVSRQIVGDATFGAAGFRYCGNILSPAGDPQFAQEARLLRSACRLADVVAREFGLTGVGGVDFIARDGAAVPIEVNPRWSASMELVERAYGLSVFAAHAGACDRGTLPEFDLIAARARADAVGKAVIFARADLVAGDTSAWLARTDVRDVPRFGEAIRAGQPVCTVLARGRTASDCYDNLVRRAAWVEARTRLWARRAA